MDGGGREWRSAAGGRGRLPRVIPRRALGRTGLEVSALGLGCNRLAEAPDRAEARATFERALERGIDLIDLADCYGNGETERLVGRWTRGRREGLVLCSKVGYRPALSVRLDRWIGPIRRRRRPRAAPPGSGGRPRPAGHFAPRTLAAGVAGSLRRLGTDRLELFYLHSPPPEVVADDAVFDALERERRAGRVLHYGISFAGNATTAHVLAALARPGLSVVQMRVNGLSTVDLGRIAPAAAASGVAVVAREPFQKGRLLAEGVPPALALRAVLHRPGVDALLVGTTRRRHLEEDLAALHDGPPDEAWAARFWSRAAVR